MSTDSLLNNIAWDAAAEFAEKPLAEPSSFGHLDDMAPLFNSPAELESWLASLDAESLDLSTRITFDFDAEFDVSDLFDIA